MVGSPGALRLLSDEALADEGRYLMRAYLATREGSEAAESLKARVRVISDEKARRVFARAAGSPSRPLEAK